MPGVLLWGVLDILDAVRHTYFASRSDTGVGSCCVVTVSWSDTEREQQADALSYFLADFNGRILWWADAVSLYICADYLYFFSLFHLLPPFNNTMSTTETNIDHMVDLSLRILRQLAKYSDRVLWKYPLTYNNPKPELNLSKDESKPDIWNKWKWKMEGVLCEESLLEKKNKERFISAKGIELLEKREDEQKIDMGKRWQKYVETRKQFDAPISTEQFREVVIRWNTDVRKKKDPDEIRKSRNAKRYLAELYLENAKLSTLENLTNSDSALVRTTLKDNFGWFLAGHFHPQMKRKNSLAYCFWGTDLFLKDGQLLPAFREALETLHKEKVIDFEEWKLIDIKQSGKTNKQPKPSTLDEDAESPESESSEEFDNDLKDIIDKILNYKKQVILYGPPGTGKTWAANKYLEAICQGVKEEDDYETWDKTYVRRCTFHPEYGYEHFIEGLRPKEDENEGNISFERKDGIFKELCQKAKDDLKQVTDEKNAHKYYLIIDEINRGEIPRIFGELITLIEANKRKSKYGVCLPLSGDKEDKFWVPPNVYIIATMNTADRSIALLDTALRRRFGFHEMKPNSSQSLFGDLQVDVPKGGKPIIVRTWFSELNNRLKKELTSRHDVEAILIGHSYFLPLHKLTKERFEDVIKYEILPLIQEYCYEDKNNAYKNLQDYIRNTTGISPIGQFASQNEDEGGSSK